MKKRKNINAPSLIYARIKHPSYLVFSRQEVIDNNSFAFHLIDRFVRDLRDPKTIK
jgi:hypothetical protein